MRYIDDSDPLAVRLVTAIRGGDVALLTKLLAEDATLPTVRIGREAGDSRSLLHIVADWPGHFPRGAETVHALVAAGAPVNEMFVGTNAETPLHWAASSNDIAVLDALLDCGADIDAPGACVGGGPPLSDATAFAQWDAARRLVERGAATSLSDAATLGLVDRVAELIAALVVPSHEDINRAFWGACHGGQQPAAELLLAHGAQLNWLPSWEPMTPLDAALRSEADDVVTWLQKLGAACASTLR